MTDLFRKTTALNFLVRTTTAAATRVSVVDRDGQGNVLPAVPDTVERVERSDLA